MRASKVVLVSPCVRVPSPYYVDWVLKRKDMQKIWPVSPTDQIPWFGSQKGCPKVEQLYGPRFAQAQAIDGKLLTLRVLSPLRTQIGCACSMWDKFASGRRSEWSGPKAPWERCSMSRKRRSRRVDSSASQRASLCRILNGWPTRSINLTCVTNAAVLHEHAFCLLL